MSKIIEGANTFAESFCGRSFDLAVYEEVIRAQPYSEYIQLSQVPLVSIIYLRDGSDTNVDIIATDDEAGVIQITSTFWDSFPTIEDAPADLYAKYQAGYDEKPSDLKLAVLSIIEDRYYAGDSSIIRERLGDRSYTKAADGLPLQAREILEKYRLS